MLADTAQPPCALISLDLLTCLWETSSVSQSGPEHSEVSRRLSRPGLHSILSFREHLKTSPRIPEHRDILFRRQGSDAPSILLTLEVDEMTRLCCFKICLFNASCLGEDKLMLLTQFRVLRAGSTALQILQSDK